MSVWSASERVCAEGWGCLCEEGRPQDKTGKVLNIEKSARARVCSWIYDAVLQHLERFLLLPCLSSAHGSVLSFHISAGGPLFCLTLHADVSV